MPPCPQVSPYDARHTLTTLSRASRAVALGSGVLAPPALHLYVHEEEPEGLARHLLLLAVLLDGQLQARERSQLLLEVHGNSLLQEGSAATLGGFSLHGQVFEGMSGWAEVGLRQEPQFHT